MIFAVMGTRVPFRFKRATGWRRRACIPVLLLLALAWQGCQDAQDPVEDLTAHRDRDRDRDHDAPTVPGEVLPGTDLEAFAEAEEAFAEVEAIDEGLGPLFNERGCAVCHSLPVVGGSGEKIERRFGTFENGEFYAYDTDPNNHGGTLRQLFSNGEYITDTGQVCSIPLETEASEATVTNVGRRTQPLFGLGLVDAIPDEFFEELARRQPRHVRGVVQHVEIALPDPRDPSQSVGSTRVGRFGWKGQVPGLLQFSGDAYNNEMGITTQSCFRGQSILAFALENYPNNVPPAEGCYGGDLAPLQAAHDDVPEFADDVVGPCDGDLTEIQDDLLLFTLFMESLAPPPRDYGDDWRDRRKIERGEEIFERIGCADCHVSTTFVTPRRPFNGVPGHYGFKPYSDFLTHDMGSLGDRIGATGDDEETTRHMRTQPLWGARFNTSFLHDGRAADIPSAIEAHDGQARFARWRFGRLYRWQQEALVRFVLSL